MMLAITSLGTAGEHLLFKEHLGAREHQVDNTCLREFGSYIFDLLLLSDEHNVYA
jgi:hypothetical protein